MHPKNIADLISSRICHDLISPVGAISNGVELLVDMNGSSPEMELISQSAENAKAKLMFFRLAFGGCTKDAMIGHAAASSVATAMFRNGRVKVLFPEPWGDRTRSIVKLLYLLILCVESSLPRGGEIICAQTASGWKISVKDTKIDANPRLWDPLLKGDPFQDLTSNQIQFQLARDAAENIDVKIGAAFSQTSLTLIF